MTKDTQEDLNETSALLKALDTKKAEEGKE